MQVIVPPGVPSVAHSPSTEATAIAFATFSLLIALIICPSLSWHASNRNVGATVLVAAAIYANFQNFLNAVIWPNDDLDSWYNGVGLCDVEIRIQIMLQSLYPAAVSCILRALARAMDTNRASWAQTRSQRRRTYAIDFVCCLGIPSIQMITLYIVQPFRYWIYGISGCVVPGDLSWLRIVLMLLPPLLWTLYCVYLSVIILVRLIRYRMTFNSVLRNANTTKSRFARLYALCLISILGYFPIQLYVLVLNISAGVAPFKWDTIHNPTNYKWDTAIKMPSNGEVLFDRYIWMGGGILIFILFGFGRDAVKMYRDGLLAIGMDRIFPSLRPGHKSSVIATVTSMGSRARMLFSSKSNASASPTFNKGSIVSTDSTTDSEPSPRKMSFLETIREGRKENPRHQELPLRQKQNQDDGKGWKFLSTYFRKSSPQQQISMNDDHFVLTQVSPTRAARIQSNVTAEPESPTMTSHIRSFSRGDADVLVRKEIRQASETEHTLPDKMYEGV